MTSPRKRAQWFTRAMAQMQDAEMPDGVCGQMRAAILSYSVVDALGTVWKPGCMDKTRAKVAAGKVDFFVAADEGYHQYGTRTHVGIVRSIGLSDDGSQEIAAVDLFDTTEGRAYKDYVQKVMQAGGNTGFSVGVYDRSPVPTYVPTPSGGQAYVFTEVELDELTGTARPAVPGTRPLAVRTDEGALPVDVRWRAFDALVASLPPAEVRARVGALQQQDPAASQGDATAQDPPTADEAPGESDAQASRSSTATTPAPEYATEAQRHRVLRLSYVD